MAFNLLDDVTTIKGVGPSSAERLNKLGIYTVYDLINHYPVRYLDFSKQFSIRELINK